MDTIGHDELRVLLDAGPVTLIEALSAANYDAGHLPGARNAPGNLTLDLAARLAPDLSATVVVYCSGPGCGRSRVTAAAFARLGYTDVRVYPGGKSDWAAAGLPLESSRTNPATATTAA
jgi:rhodanese-related sulfurtransferase